MIRRSFVVAAFVTFAAALALPREAHSQVPAPASASVEAGGVRFPARLTLGNSELKLNGAGVRYKAVFKVYAAGLYLAAPAATTEAVLGAAGPRRLHIVMLREIDANELGKLFTKGIENNTSREEFAKVIPGVIKMSDIFSLRKKLSPGEYFTIDYVPGTGSVISIQGKPASEPIKEPEFFSAMMKIWLGKSPADAQLKDRLLGHAPSLFNGNSN